MASASVSDPPDPQAPRLSLTRLGVASLGRWPLRRWSVAAAAAVATALAVGIPTGVLHTSLYTRMTPVTWWDYPVWGLTAVLVGLTAGTYVRDQGRRALPPDGSARTAGATLLSAFAVGCPICNKLVVALLGVSGALAYFGPVQPVLGAVGVVMLAAGLVIRLRASVACPSASRRVRPSP